MPQDPKTLLNERTDLMATLLAIGLDPERCTIFHQDEVSGDFFFSCVRKICLTSSSAFSFSSTRYLNTRNWLGFLIVSRLLGNWIEWLLGRWVEFKDLFSFCLLSTDLLWTFFLSLPPAIVKASDSETSRISFRCWRVAVVSGFVCLPSLTSCRHSSVQVSSFSSANNHSLWMTAQSNDSIYLFYFFCRATHVPVGEDQVQHLELSRDIAAIFNRNFSKKKHFFPLPQHIISESFLNLMSLSSFLQELWKSANSSSTPSPSRSPRLSTVIPSLIT